MLGPSLLETLIEAQSDGTALSNTVTPTSIIPLAAKLTLPANFFKIGRKLWILAAGRISTVVTTPGTLTLDLRLGGVIAGNGGAMSLNIVAKSNVPWTLGWLFTCRAIGGGTSTNLMHQGEWKSEAVIGAAVPTVGGAGTHLLPNATPAVGTGFDGGASQTVDLFATWSVANAANSIQLHQFAVIDA